jgi:proton glutamate symport protein
MKRLTITHWVFVGMAAGIVLGVTAPEFSRNLGIVSNIFLRLIKSIIAPLLFGTLVAGVAGSGSAKTMGRVGGKAMAYFLAATTVALVIGLIAVNFVQPGAGMNFQPDAAEGVKAGKQPTFASFLEHAVPQSVIGAMAEGEVLQVVIFCLIFGAACTVIGERARPMVEFAESLGEVMFQYTKYVMYLAPFAVGAAIAVVIGTKGLGVLFNLGKLIATVFGALVFFVVAVLGFVTFVFRIPLGRFIQAVKDPVLLAFSTASSESALPLALQNMEKFGVPKHIVGLVLPLGYSFNLDGTTLYLSAASMFVAQMAGVAMSPGQQFLMMATLLLTSKGVAGVPRASLVILAATLSAFNLPQAGVAVILGVDAILDMARTSVNVLGNCVASAVVARLEGVDLQAAPKPHE